MVKCVLSKNVSMTGESAAEVMRLLATGWKIESLHNGEVVQRISRVRRRRAPNVTPEQLKEMIGLKAKGLTYRIIARRFKMSQSGAMHAIRRATASKSKKGA
jgi:hypothetical protein